MLLTSGGSAKPPPRPARLPALTETYVNRAMGASGALPHGWSAVRSTGLLRLAGPGGHAVIVIAAVPGRKTASLLETSLAAIRRTYHATTVKPGPGTRLGGLPAASVVVYGENAHHVPVRILLAVAQARRRAYVVEAFTARSATRTELVETQEAINTLRLG